MNIAKAYTGGFLKAAKLPRMLLILYFANIFMALLLALPFMGMLRKSFGQSRIIEDFINNFDYTAFSNMMYYDGQAITAILGGIKWFVLAYFLLSVFLTGGIIGTYHRDEFTTRNFFGAGAYNFFRFLGLNLLTIVVQLFVFIIVYVPLTGILQGIAPNVESELKLYNIAIGGFILHGLIFLLISMIGDYAKFYLVMSNSFNVFKGFWQGMKYVFGHFLKTYMLYLFLLFLPAVVMYIYLYVERDIKMATGFGILMVFFMQQAFIFFRNFLRAWILASQYMVFESDFTKKEEFPLLISEEKPKKIVEESEQAKQNIHIQEEVEQDVLVEQSSYRIDFNTTFSTENKAPDKETKDAEKEFLKTIIPEQPFDDHTEFHKLHSEISGPDEESVQNTKEEQLNEIQENDDDTFVEKMIEHLEDEEKEISDQRSSDQVIDFNAAKNYVAGETVDFDDESIIEEQLTEKLVEEDREEQIEQKMIDHLENEGTIIADDSQKVGPESENPDQKAYFSNENLDSEAFISDNQFNHEGYEENYDANDDSDSDDFYTYEIIEQNVIEEDMEQNEDEEKKKTNKTDQDDHFEFEL